MQKRNIPILFISILSLLLIALSLASFQKVQISAEAIRGACSLSLEGTPHCIDIKSSVEGASCRDETLDESCSTQKPLYCSNGNLYEFCGKCGCERGSECLGGRCIPLTCQSMQGSCQESCGEGYVSFKALAYSCAVPSLCGNGVCEGTESCSSCQSDCGTCQETCQDGTAYGQCSQDQSQFCNQGVLEANCLVNCPGCPEGYSCDPTSKSCVQTVSNPQTICGNGICEIGEDCDICTSDCPVEQGSVCCQGSEIPGNCCSSLTCGSGQQCVNNACCAAECGSDQECNTLYPDLGGSLLCYGAGQCEAYCAVPDGGSPLIMKTITGRAIQDSSTCCIAKKDYPKVFKKYMGYVCPDGTIYGACSRIKPYFCDKGVLVPDCGKCGCFYGVCEEDNMCKVDEQTQRILQAQLFTRQSDIGARLLGNKLIIPSLITRPRTTIINNKTQVDISGVQLTMGINRVQPELGITLQP